MKNKLINVVLTLSLLMMGVGIYFGYTSSSKAVDVAAGQEAIKQLAAIKAQEAKDATLGQYAINMMFRSGAQKIMSKGMMLMLARSIVRVGNDIFPDEEQKRRDLVMVLAIESGFSRFAQSPTGPKGYGQLAKSSFHEAMADCGVTGLRDEDVWETDLNLYAAACYFKKMLNASENDTGLAAVSYNQGSNSDSAKSYKKSGDMKELEPLRYLTKITFLTKTVSDKKTPGVPDLKDLPSPIPPKSAQSFAPKDVK